MDASIIVAVISAVVALISVFIGSYAQIRLTKMQDRLDRQREAESREAIAEALLARYRDPLIRAASDLQSRLYNIIKRGFLAYSYKKSEATKRYAINNTLYVIAEYLGWVEVLRREIQFLDLGDIKENQIVQERLNRVTHSFLTDSMDPPFRLFRGEQRAIGELMLVEKRSGSGRTYDCIGFAEFTGKIADPDFSRWFEELRKSIDTLANKPNVYIQRLVSIQHALIDLIDSLDPEKVRVPKGMRDKIKLN